MLNALFLHHLPKVLLPLCCDVEGFIPATVWAAQLAAQSVERQHGHVPQGRCSD